MQKSPREKLPHAALASGRLRGKQCHALPSPGGLDSLAHASEPATQQTRTKPVSAPGSSSRLGRRSGTAVRAQREREREKKREQAEKQGGEREKEKPQCVPVPLR